MKIMCDRVSVVAPGHTYFLFDTKLLTITWWDKLLAVRTIRGIGFTAKDTNIHPLLFSERYGYRKGFMVGNWWICFYGLHYNR